MDDTNRDCMNCLHLGWDRGLLLCVSRVPEEKLAVHNFWGWALSGGVVPVNLKYHWLETKHRFSQTTHITSVDENILIFPTYMIVFDKTTNKTKENCLRNSFYHSKIALIRRKNVFQKKWLGMFWTSDGEEKRPASSKLVVDLIHWIIIVGKFSDDCKNIYLRKKKWPQKEDSRD